MKSIFRVGLLGVLVPFFMSMVLHAEEIQIGNIITDLPYEGNISTEGEVDIYTFTATKTGKYAFYSTYLGETYNSGLDTKATLEKEDGTEIITNDDGNSYLNFLIQATLIQGQTYHLKVYGYSSAYTGIYKLHSVYKMVSNSVPNLEGFEPTGTIDAPGDINTFTFVSNDSGVYTIVSKGNFDTYGTLYSDSGVVLISDDDNGTDYNFKLSYTLEANTSYTLEVKSFVEKYTGSYTLEYTAVLDNHSVAKDDFNGDGISDILWRKGSINHIWLMNEDLTHTYVNIGGKSEEYNVTGRGDFNGDGISDILWRKGHKNYIWYMHADGTHDYQKIASKSYAPEGIADFNNDGIDDILWRNGSTNHIWYMSADGNHTYINIGGKSTDYTVGGTGDFNGDGISDILWKKGYKNYIWYMHSDGTHTYKKVDSKAQELVGIDDFDKDGIADIIWSNGATWYMNRDGSHYLGSTVNLPYERAVYEFKILDIAGKMVEMYRYNDSNEIVIRDFLTNTPVNLGTKSNLFMPY